MAHIDPETAQLWDRFHGLVNMRSPDLRAWLEASPDDPEAYLPDPDVDVLEDGPRVLHLLDKRRTDLTPADTELMRQVVDAVVSWLADPREDDERWRYSLMRLGHDPLKADSPRDADVSASP